MKHAAHRSERPARRPGRIAVATAALVGAVVVLMGGQGTFAFWTDQAAVSTGNFSSGRLDLTVDGQQGKPTPYVKTSLTLGSMLPGESVAQVITVANAGDAPLSWVPQVSKSGGLGPALTVELTVGTSSTVQNTTTYPRTGTCSPGSPIIPGGRSATLPAGGTQQLCVKVMLPAATGNEYQAVTEGAVAVGLAASQVTP